jgi:hypothetical protein
MGNTKRKNQEKQRRGGKDDKKNGRKGWEERWRGKVVKKV